ncbi:pentapeptide repeat-containing protein [cyanobacterium endosymbiont of Epithemia clementina EcSB]|nr:pentapeptide repeat-containing protein [cyanobacterium endosymbiont of Epithemia clementina EcSB]WGT68513.1 pentapeptide repeat-containing protein [cyanobacterium endosymbiont of Epithemia clementina EcSB]
MQAYLCNSYLLKAPLRGAIFKGAKLDNTSLK